MLTAVVMGVSYRSTTSTVNVFFSQHQYVIILDTIATMTATPMATLTQPTNDASTAGSGQLNE